MIATTLSQLSDDLLHQETRRAAACERQSTAGLLRLLIEVERRKLHLAMGHSSLFSYCVKSLLLSEHAAYGRITAARAARRRPQLLDLLAEGSLTLSSVGLLAPLLTDDTAEILIEAAKFKSTRDVERMIASAFPQPDIATRITPVTQNTEAPGLQVAATEPVASTAPSPLSTPAPPRPVVAPISPTRYLLKVTVSSDTEQKLQRARALLRHAVPDGDLDAVLNRALTLLLADIERAKAGLSRRPRSRAPALPRGRHIPAAVRRAVWERDSGRCTFTGAAGICGETSFLEFHHVVPFAAGGPTTVANLQLRCRAHNAHEASVHFSQPGTDLPTRRAPS